MSNLSISVIFTVLVGSAIIPFGSGAFAQQSQNTSSQTNTTAMTAFLKPVNFAANTVALEAKMLQLTASNDHRISPHLHTSGDIHL